MELRLLDSFRVQIPMRKAAKWPPRDEFVLEILRYVVAHPTAKDTIRGIEKWWLSRSLSREARRKLEQRLNLLVARGWLIGRGSPQSETIYSLNQNSLDEINEFLAKGN